MGVIAIKRVYDPPAAGDGFRVLVDRLWPRGVSKEAAALDLWAKDLAPTPDLRREFNHRAERFTEFTHHYRVELARNPAVAAFLPQLKRAKVTLLYGARDPKVNHAIVLADFLRKADAPAKKKAAKKATAKKAAAKKPVRKRKAAKKKLVPRKVGAQAATRSRSR
jgi:uncharacterized protein YeaO (DUF488 family)